MIRRRQHHAQHTYDLLQEQEHARLVACPPPPEGCGAPVGTDCVRLYRRPPREYDDVHRTACPPPPEGCGVAHGEQCVTPHGGRRQGPGCWRRVQLADVAHPQGAHPALPAPTAPTAPGRRLLPVDQARRDIAAHVQPCGWCHGRIVHATTCDGGSTPVDAEPSPAGRLLLSVDDRGVRCHPLTAGQVAGALDHGHRVHTAHRETCPQGTRPHWGRGVHVYPSARRT
ncbi:hypothetical protein [Saccharothrix australiensis]|uniref:Uncharacterized protein n=1 Tax=Saccharothrix australiensis TaxID=2072 RepID=A0A495VJ07_9PSEU|nr:hypothetical protein [Saccharothrix australiensis]RKT49296.1 hypothetical protein C8E97_6792 [Saccharothrix australiensis]